MQIEISELAALLGKSSNGCATKRDLGQQIVVLDRGFVYVGNVEVDGEYTTITNARNIRKWGTTNGLGELRNGPLPETKMDVVGTVLVSSKAVMHYIAARGF